ncbi:putative vacuolar protein sorting-associated protein 72-like [Penaeus vannamei]|uniref:Putative vacuolar protein sorting-associated protein 72-like n=1 Tax=Penaeus vannamei TaxID=6689 RepID=A0A423T866_PENVA|nr:putative vacuolar protein sorting-associated protein 72-like [Penaeus vannamei]
MAASRERRNNAGAKMSQLLDEEEEDDFYKTTYGGFSEEADDVDYQSEVEQDDEVDSDFSIDENDEPVSDQEEDNKEGKKKRGRLITKAYKLSSPFFQTPDVPGYIPDANSSRPGFDAGHVELTTSSFMEAESITWSRTSSAPLLLCMRECFFPGPFTER